MRVVRRRASRRSTPLSFSHFVSQSFSKKACTTTTRRTEQEEPICYHTRISGWMCHPCVKTCSHILDLRYEERDQERVEVGLDIPLWVDRLLYKAGFFAIYTGSLCHALIGSRKLTMRYSMVFISGETLWFLSRSTGRSYPNVQQQVLLSNRFQPIYGFADLVDFFPFAFARFCRVNATLRVVKHRFQYTQLECQPLPTLDLPSKVLQVIVIALSKDDAGITHLGESNEMELVGQRVQIFPFRGCQ